MLLCCNGLTQVPTQSNGNKPFVMPPVALPIIRRETAPSSHRAWLEVHEGAFATLKAVYGDWLKSVSAMERMFANHVYENKDAGEPDFRQHRMHLYSLLADGELLATRLIFEANSPEAKKFVELIDDQLDQLRKTLHEWHGELEHQSDVPKSFKHGAAAIDEGKVIDLGKALAHGDSESAVQI